MKKFWAFIMVFASCLTGFAQMEFAPIGAEWYYNQPSSTNSNYIYLESVKDTVVHDKSCRIIEVWLNGLKLISREYLRQTNDSVLYFNTNSDSFHLLYNFGAKVGDTITVHKGKFKPTKAFFSDNDSIPSFRYKIVSTDSIQVSGIWVKRQKVVSFKDDLWGVTKPDGNDYYVLDKIGSLAYFFGVQAGITPEDNLSICRCYSDSHLAFRSPLWDYDCDISTGIQPNIKAEDKVFVLNPVHDQISLKMSEPIEWVQIYDINGMCLIAKDMKNNSFSIDVSPLSQGIYFLRIKTKQKTYSKKLVKQ